MNDFSINPMGPHSELSLKHGLKTWRQLLEHIKGLPYGRNATRSDFGLVLTESRGTCSSKHAFLASVARENDHPEIRLLMVIYQMNATNTPGIGSVLEGTPLSFVPEAHCILKIDDQYVDCTSTHSDFEAIKKDVLFRQEIHPQDVVRKKIALHQDFIKKWQTTLSDEISFEEIWALRETCIRRLSQ